MSTFDITFEEFKQMCGEFHKELPTMNQEELENSWKALGLGYLGMNEPMWQNSAAIALQIVSKEYVIRKMQLDPIDGN